MATRERFHPRNSGKFSGTGSACVHDDSDDRLSIGREEGGAAREEGRELSRFEAAVSRGDAQRKLIDDLLALFGGRTQPVMARLIESGKLTLADVKEAEKTLRKLERKDKP